MPDIFLSYAREDRDRVEPLAAALAERGWSVFWDREIPAGQTWRTHIGTALNDAGCVIVAWSQDSIASEWVSEEADEARARGALVPVLLDAVAPPIGFRSIQAADLSEWRPGRESPLFDQLLRDVEAVLGAGPRAAAAAGAAPSQARRRRSAWPLAAAAAAFAALAAVASFLWLRPPAPAEDSAARELVEPEPQVTGEPQPAAPAPASRKYWLSIGELTCESAEGIWKRGTDEPYLVVNGTREWGPRELRCPGKLAVEAAPIELGGDTVTIELWESDSTEGYNGGDDLLGRVEVPRRVGRDEGAFVENKARYILQWEIIREEQE